MTNDTLTTVQVHRIFINASAQAVWDAVTSPGWSERYGYGGSTTYDLRPGGAYQVKASPEMLDFGAPEIVVDGEVIEADPPRKLVQTWRMLMDPEAAAEGFTRLTYEIEDAPGGGVRLTVAHDLTGAPKLALMVSGEMLDSAGGGWDWVLSSLKTLLETGEPYPRG